jgi:hypothetical protein
VLRRNFALAMALAVVASLMLAGGAFARDRNHDRIPDKWEKRHHLSLHKKQGRRDQDRDGLRNRAEWKSRLNPRDADTDDDGIKDGEEHTGKVESFDGTTLVISLFSGGTVSGAVTDETDVECDSDPADDHGQDDGDGQHGDNEGDNNDDQGDNNDDQGDNNDDQGDDDRGARAASSGDDGDHGNEDCGTDALVPGAKVLEAELKISGGEAVWEEVELATP